MSEEQVQENQRGSRGEVGKGTPSTKIKALWKREGKSNEALKRFARRMIKEKKNTDAQMWFDCKAGKFDMERSEKNIARIQLERQASKSTKKK